MFSKIKDFYNTKVKKETQPQTVVRADQIEEQQRKIREQERQRAESEYQQEHPEQIIQENLQSFENKTNKLKKKLNIAIITIFGLIVLVFLILFYI
ncbi:hypothetical protein LCR01_08670 [Companilactobacillus crustorum]|uniref:Uncharacterized protein n=3 Tax=Companilactobacillus TaxID=2767879 RepID=A0A837RK89_9LACO|nr:hypothetical protein [Companilactobacillus crustorum]HCD08156.1 hypothetical protein [Lactobacillus sp.]APU71598.1 hypothetical protein BI355_1279 [Companilactobacillus crustorum]KRK42783.1 hypothetical protein FD26_GL000397 [Companilactobacillus crustorum JCM 15951]KRO20419.1 hypothetical protein IV63_GL000554 [Companilactobacillus crustorum]WDT66381.1 hypothetical protein NV391_04045 [Companilactobacillus crustorum]